MLEGLKDVAAYLRRLIVLSLGLRDVLIEQ